MEGMEQMGAALLWCVAMAGVLMILRSQHWLLDAVIEAINNRRGGPPTAMHPSPSNDGALLRRRRRKMPY